MTIRTNVYAHYLQWMIFQLVLWKGQESPNWRAWILPLMFKVLKWEVVWHLKKQRWVWRMFWFQFRVGYFRLETPKWIFIRLALQKMAPMKWNLGLFNRKYLLSWKSNTTWIIISNGKLKKKSVIYFKIFRFTKLVHIVWIKWNKAWFFLQIRKLSKNMNCIKNQQTLFDLYGKSSSNCFSLQCDCIQLHI